jgi:arsenite methyltransferase
MAINALPQAAQVDRHALEQQVKDMYRRVAEQPHANFHFALGRTLTESLGYPPRDLDRIPAAAIESFAGVGYPLGLAACEVGETVVDLGSGSGTDSFVAALRVGPSGRVHGIDMTDAQRIKAEQLARQDGFANVHFHAGYIESLPLKDSSVDVVISNGVINLAPDKYRVFAEAARVLRPGGRLAISDIVTEHQLPEKVTCDSTLWAACIGGAMQQDDYVEAIKSNGFEVVSIEANTQYAFLTENARRRK